MEPLRLGIVGIGFATRLMMPALMNHAGVQLVAAADPRKPARERFAQEFGGRVFVTAEDMFADGNIDAVYIATPSFLHATQIELAAAAGKHVVVEKPMVLTEAEVVAVEKAVRRAGIAFVCGHTHAFDPPVVKMAEIARSGNLGAVTMVTTANYTDLMYRPRTAWEMDTTAGGGAVFMQAPHQIDIVRAIVPGALLEVVAHTVRSDPERPTEGAYSALCRFGSGAAACLVYNGYGYFDTARWHYWRGERGELRDPDTHQLTWQKYRELRSEPSDNVSAGSLPDEHLRESRRYGGQDATAMAVARSAPFFGVTIASCERGDLYQSPNGVVICDRSGSHEVDLSDLPDGATAVINELYESVTSGQPGPHDVSWAAETTRGCIGIVQSANSGAPVRLEPSLK